MPITRSTIEPLIATGTIIAPSRCRFRYRRVDCPCRAARSNRAIWTVAFAPTREAVKHFHAAGWRLRRAAERAGVR
jgi:hypothetical protein